jgi:putative DNA methylase
MKYRKKLIEVALPLDAINKASAREKSIRHGHPSTLHLWWARRPLAAARAVIFAQMVDDPSTYVDVLKSDPRKRRRAASILKIRRKAWEEAKEVARQAAAANIPAPEPGPEPTLDEVLAELERERLFQIIEELVQWENTNNEEVLQRAREEIWQSWRRACADNADHPRARELFDRHKLPAFHDPFAGGGSLPLEAQRLGLEAYASDLNPVAVLINKAMIEIPPKFAGCPPVNPAARAKKTLFEQSWPGARGLAEDVRYYGQWMRDEAEKRIGHLYPKVKITADMVKERPDLKPYTGKELTVIAWIWARTVKSPNPAFAHVDVPLASTFMLSTKKGKEAYIEPVIEGDSYRFTVKVGKPRDPEAAKKGTKLGRGANFKCLLSGTPIAGDYIKAEGRAGRMGARLMAIVAEGEGERVYLPPLPEHEAVARKAVPEWRPEIPIAPDPRALWTPPYGLTTFGDLFTNRQLVALTTFSDLVLEVRERVRQDAVISGLPDDGVPLADGGTGASAYGDAVALYLGFAIDYAANYWSVIATPAEGFIRGTFARQALPMTWDFAEAPPFGKTSGSWLGGIEWITKALVSLPSAGFGTAEQMDAVEQSLSIDKIVSTDPPYYDNIGYADLSDYFYLWLRRSLKMTFPNLFSTITVPKAEELVAITISLR